jgi:hypothetical protein
MQDWQTCQRVHFWPRFDENNRTRPLARTSHVSTLDYLTSHQGEVRCPRAAISVVRDCIFGPHGSVLNCECPNVIFRPCALRGRDERTEAAFEALLCFILSGGAPHCRWNFSVWTR